MKASTRWAISLFVLMVICSQSQVSRAQAGEQKSFERSFKVTAAVELAVKTGSEDLKVRGGNEGEVLVQCIVKSQNDRDFDDEDVSKAAQYVESNLPVRQEGNRIVIDPVGNREILRHLNIEYDLTVPANSQLNYETGSGDLIVENIRGPVDYGSGSGDAKVVSVQDGVRVRTGSGDVMLESAGKGAIDVSTESGDVSVQLDAHTGYDVTAHTGSGDFSIAPEITLEAGDTKSEIHGKVRGGGTPVKLHTGSGDIRVE